MSQIGAAHKMLMRHLEGAAHELELVFVEPGSEAAFTLEATRVHLENARRLAEQIDSGIVYSGKEEET